MILVIVGLLPSCFGWYKDPFIFRGFMLIVDILAHHAQAL